jgi:hypothetical protein
LVWCVKTKLQSTKSWGCCIPILDYWIMVYQNVKILHSFCHSIILNFNLQNNEDIAFCNLPLVRLVVNKFQKCTQMKIV